MQVPSRITRRKIRILQSELQMLQHYSSEIFLLFDDYKMEYHKDFSYFRERANKIASPIDDEDSPLIDKNVVVIEGQPDQEENKDPSQSANEALSQKPEWAKKLFKKIALMTHPDRINDEALREKLQRIFLRAGKALESNNMDDLIGVALELNLDSGLEDAALVPMLETKVKKTKEEIAEIENSVEWLWGESLGVLELRTQLLHRILTKEGFSLSKDQIADIILERESSDETR